MKIVRPYANITLLSGVTLNWENVMDPLRVIEAAARVSHRSEDLQTETSAERFVRAVVIQHGDWSVVEHVTASVEFLVDRGITHEIVRHRLFSYTQESTRFVNYAKKMPPSFIYPKPEVECEKCLSGEEPIRQFFAGDPYWDHGLHSVGVGAEQVVEPIVCPYAYHWINSITSAEWAYKHLLEEGWRPQEARSIFPNALASKLVMTGNLRNWRQFFLMRTTKEAHPQMRQVTIPLLKQFQAAVPVLFEDIEPEARQADNIAKGR